MKKVWKISIAAMIMTMLLGMTAYAGSWQESFRGKWWKNDDGSYPTSGWHWIDCKNDGTAECYYFDENGYVLVNTTTPDGYKVNENGEWIVEEIVGEKVKQRVQQQKVEIQGSVSYVQENDSSLKIGTMVSPGCRNWNFYLHTPKNLTDNMPMIVLLHGGKMGEGAFSILKEECIFQYMLTNEKISENAIIIYPQYVYENHNTSSYADVTHDIARIAQLVARDYKVDMNRIYVTGGSKGGNGTIFMCKDYPELFACGVSITGISGPGPRLKDFMKATEVPLWMIIEDTSSAVEASQKVEKGIKENGGTVWLTVDTGADHASTAGFNSGVDKFGVYDWMLTQKKN